MIDFRCSQLFVCVSLSLSSSSSFFVPSRLYHYRFLMWSRRGHLSVPSSVLRRVVRLEHACLRLVRLREGVPSLLAHALYLAHLADRLLELLHPDETRTVSKVPYWKQSRGENTWVCSPGYCTSGSPGCGDNSEACTSALHTCMPRLEAGTAPAALVSAARRWDWRRCAARCRNTPRIRSPWGPQSRRPQ